MRFSHSRLETYENCPFRFKLRYIEKLETLPNWDDASNPLIIGTALHHGLENGAESAVREYLNAFPVITEKHEEEALKLEYLIPKGKALIPENSTFEVEISDGDNFIGYIDLLTEVEDGMFDIYDFKYSNHVDKYLESRQLHLYKFFAEKVLGIKVRKLYFMFFPKIAIRQKKTEIPFQFRERLRGELEKAQVNIVEVPYDKSKVEEYFNRIEEVGKDKTFNKNQTRLCDWCEYQKYCEEGDDTMILPKNERRSIEGSKKKVMWIYGQPFSGKTFLANKFPCPIMLNSDGNIKYVDAPYIAIRNEVESTGRVTNTTLAWDVFKDAITELEKGQGGKNGFKTIVVDLLEDMYEYCRLYMYKQMNITHESDDSFKAWDKVRTEFLSTIKRLINMDYENIILLSHEDSTRDIMKRTGDKITSIKPNISDKIANKIAGMVDIVIRYVVADNERILTFKTDEVVFGGGRLNLAVNEIPATYEDLMRIYSESQPVPVEEPHEAKPERKTREVAQPEKAPEPEAPVESQEETTHVEDAEPVVRKPRKRRVISE